MNATLALKMNCQGNIGIIEINLKRVINFPREIIGIMILLTIVVFNMQG